MNFTALESLIDMNEHIEYNFKRFFINRQVNLMMNIHKKSIDDMIVICPIKMINEYDELKYLSNRYSSWFVVNSECDNILITFRDKKFPLIDYKSVNYE